MNGFELRGITHLSASSLNLWINCPSLWVAEKIFYWRRGPSPSMARGIAVEEAAVRVLAHGHAIEDATEAALEGFDAGIFLADEKSTKERALIKPMIIQTIEALAPLGMPEIPSTTKQKKIELICNCGDFKIPIVGYLDFVFPDTGRIVDLKTTQRMPGTMPPEHRLQRAIYQRATGNQFVQFLYVTDKRHGFLPEEGNSDLNAELSRVKQHVKRLEAFLRLLDPEQMRAIVPICDTSFYWTGAEAGLSEIFGLPGRDPMPSGQAA